MVTSVAPDALAVGVAAAHGSALVDHDSGSAAMTISGCPAQQVGYACITHSKGLRPGLTCPLGHAMSRKREPFYSTASRTF